MTGNPHTEHGPLWVERNALPGQDFPHALRRMDGEILDAVDDAGADAIEAQLTPLPDGVYRARLGHKRGHELAAGYELPAGWTAPGLHGGGPWVSRVLVCRIPAEPTAPEPAAAPFCVPCDGYGVTLPVGSSIVVTCPVCNGKTADRPERGPKAAPAAAPPVDTDDARRLADELDAHRATRAELVALVAELREDGAKFKQYGYIGIANALARILGEQP